MRGLSGRVVLVAGGGGIGAATTARLAHQGVRVALGDVDEASARVVAEEICDAGGSAIALGYDQADEQSVAELVAQTVRHFGVLDGLHANAADLSPETVGRDKNLLKMDVAVWERTLRVNLVGYAVLIREALPHLLAQGKGSVVCTSSAGSELGGAAQPAYASSKAGVNALVRHVANRWGAKGIRANAVSPGMVLSARGREVQTENSLQAMQSATPSFRLGDPDDIAGVVAFLMSDDGEWVNGQVWGVNGGLITRG